MAPPGKKQSQAERILDHRLKFAVAKGQGTKGTKGTKAGNVEESAVEER